MQLRASLVAALVLSAFAPVTAAAEPVDPAQVIAQKFSEDSQPPPASSQGAPGADYETDMLRRARAEELERQNASEEAIIKVAAPPHAATSPAANKPEAPPAASAGNTTPSTQETPPSGPNAIARPNPVQAPRPTTNDVEGQPKSGSRVTVLLVLGDGDGAAGAVKPDPIICFDQSCWISNGIEAPAHPMPRSQALALKSTDHAASDSCDGKSGCVFRDIALSPDARIEVVEVGESRGVADGSFTVNADASCRNEDGDLVCDNALVTQGFRIWVVPEPTAQAAGAPALEEAVAEGLPDESDDAQPEDGK